MRTSFFATVLFMCIAMLCNGQESDKITNWNTSEYPQICFDVNHYPKDGVTPVLHLKENGLDMPFSITEYDCDYSDSSRNILVLLEDLASNGPYQSAYSREALISFLSVARIHGQDNFYIATYNRKKTGTPILDLVYNQGTNDVRTVINAIANQSVSNERFSDFPHRADVYTAVREGIELLENVPGAKAIFLITAGHPMETSGAESESQVIISSQKKHIPVFVFEYTARSGGSPKMEGLANCTQGLYANFSEPSYLAQTLQSYYESLPELYFGHRYQVAYQTNAQRGNAVNLAMEIDGVPYTQQLTLPASTFRDWISDNLILFIAICVVVVVLVVLLIVWIQRNDKRHKSELNQLEIDKQRLESETEDKFRKMREQEAERAHEEAKRKQVEAQRKRDEELASLMHSKRAYPRIQCIDGNNRFLYEIKSIRTTIGRKSDNTIVLKSPSVSKCHATISFDGLGFVIADNNSANKVRVNDSYITQCALSNGDIIWLGDAKLVFTV